MVNSKPKYVLSLLLLLIWQGAFAQGHLFSNVELKKNTVYVGEPVEVTVSVFTSTWFTKGVNPGNIKVNGAFTVYFRSISSSQRIDGKTYAGVKMIFNVFPYDDKDILFPSLKIKVETPDEGGSKGIPRIINTEAKDIVVKPVPAGYNKAEWMVASGITVSNNWLGDRTKVEVGDILERNIKRDVPGTVSELIPPLVWDTISGVSIYSGRPAVNNNKSKTAISASRSESVRYLFEKEGEVEIPEIVITWWNPQANKLQKRTLKKVIINVQANPDLGMLESIRDSLTVLNATVDAETNENKGITIFGLSLKKFALVLFLLFLLSFTLYKIYYPIKKILTNRRELYKNSELFYFRKFQNAVKLKNTTLATQLIYRWIDQIQLKEPTLQYFAETYGTIQLRKEVNELEKRINSNESVSSSFNYKLWSVARKNYLVSNIQNEQRSSLLRLNP